MLTFGSLFAGIGGLDLGLERAGLTCRWQVEIDDYARRVLAKHWPDVPRYGDIRELTGEELEPVDLICGGFPCQPVSRAGAKQAERDPGWLWPEFARLVGVLRPRFMLVENVSDLLHRGMGSVLGDLATLGYDAEWSIVSACALGAPFTRERLFIVAYPDSDRRERTGLPQKRGAHLFGPARGDSTIARQSLSEPGHWQDEPEMARVAHGVPARVDRLRGLGNAVVPQVAEWIGRRIAEATA